MKTATRFVFGAWMLLSGGMLLAQSPNQLSGPAVDYFPLHPKTKWTYMVQDQEVVVTVSGIEKVMDEDCIKVDTLFNERAVASECFVVRSDGVYRVKVKDDLIVP